MISFEREILETLRRRNPDLMNAFVCLGLAAEAGGVVTMAAPGPLAHVPHKRRAGMISALVAAGFLKRTAGGYLVNGVSSDTTAERQKADAVATSGRKAQYGNVSQNNSGWAEDRQAKDSEPIPEEESEAHALVELVSDEPWEELAHGDNAETTGEGQTEDAVPTADREASCSNTSRNNSEWARNGQTEGSEALTDAFLDITDDHDEPGEIEGMAALESLLDSLPAGPQRQAPVIGMGLRRPPVAISSAPAPAADDEPQVDARAREKALEAWEMADARTFETCQGQFSQYWTYRKQHFLALARQELGPSAA